jgi:predicted secreted protein
MSKENMETIKLVHNAVLKKRGQHVVRLPANSSAFQWEVQDLRAGGCINVDETAEHPPKAQPGSEFFQVFTITTCGTGEETIRFVYTDGNTIERDKPMRIIVT